jgi:ATP-dependent RNA helicase RhlE
MSKLKFIDMPLIAPIQKALLATGYAHPTLIQERAIPLVLANHDLLGIAQTGTGKTAAFALPLIQKLHEHKLPLKPRTPRVLVLAPTRELALQIQKNIQDYGKYTQTKSTVIFGGVGQGNQVSALAAGVDILVATTGRLLDLIQQKYVFLDRVEFFVLDEADRMLDMGFFPDIRRILNLLPKKRQNLFFSATMPKEVQGLAASILVNPLQVEVTPQAKTADRIKQSMIYVDKENKFELLTHLLDDANLFKVIIFMEMKHAANKIADRLEKIGVPAAAFHSNKSQGARQRALADFQTDKIRVLVATDIAARGIDIDGITHVINYDLSHLTDSYVHRIGRTARAGAEGEAISFCTAEERSYVFAIEKAIRQNISVNKDHPFHSDKAEKAQVMSVGKAKAILESQRKTLSSSNRPPRRHQGPKSKQGPKSESGQKPKSKRFQPYKGKR